MSDLIERLLRLSSGDEVSGRTYRSEIEAEAANEIERLQARVEKLEAALRIVPGFVTNRARADFVKDTLAATEQGDK